MGERYLGDGLYASHDGYQITLRAPRPGGDHFVCLEEETTEALLKYLKEIEAKIKILRDGVKAGKVIHRIDDKVDNDLDNLTLRDP